MVSEVDDWLVSIAPTLLAYFVRRVVSAEDAADLLGETLLQLWRRADALLDDPHDARMYAFGVARNVLRGHRRTNQRRSALAGRLRSELSSVDEVAHPADERVMDLRAALDRLKPIDQEILRLVHWDGLSLVETATVIGMREATVRSRYHRVRARLRQQLE
ncbi:sigma-70 family RNA polymerase sigma factor [Nocardioides sp. KC13]|uniref:Sigma-70 family RNA polymerase sigma factor n=2 Tax=Nocardioides turkmenicus TaxID=2711220 RepID=A0A6M1QRQ4_9ACTN|nr:sigma-70 family RNA polymerase sigma factor [Nocardioides sp. KC13]NGN92523.1 sigma-70 family RNA polymerase sigma factor [Nocardioides sp. KC13]